MNTLYDLRDMLCDELDEIVKKGNLSAGDLDVVHKLVSTMKNIDKITMYEDGYSRGGDWSADIRGNYGKGSSYNNRGKHYVRGHYSRTDAKEHMRAQIEDMLRNSDNDRVREALRRCMDSLET